MLKNQLNVIFLFIKFKPNLATSLGQGKAFLIRSRLVIFPAWKVAYLWLVVKHSDAERKRTLWQGSKLEHGDKVNQPALCPGRPSARLPTGRPTPDWLTCRPKPRYRVTQNTSMYTRIQFVSDTIKGNGHCKKKCFWLQLSTVGSLSAGCLSETKVLAAFFEYGE